MLKILCLHGYRQNGQVFKDKTGSLRKLLKKQAEFVYITAPHLIPVQFEKTESENETAEQKGWYFSTEASTFNSHDATDFSHGLLESLEVVEKAFLEQGPFDGIIGFSQGAALSSIICHLLQKGELKYSFKFVILVSGFRSRLSPHAHYYQSPNTIPSLHVIGQTDRIVEKEMSEELTGYFEAPKVLCHGGGHYVPATSKEKGPYIQFLEQFMQ